ncbi:pentapeptide repeat-containing protein [Nonomuraea sp. NPDC049655]|uniref:pentapeptide repeat-containing protein n=1 Tax=Nonomuraea sp. NPDC049655 TaxID=3364355 RepID=UPI0037B503AD
MRRAGGSRLSGIRLSGTRLSGTRLSGTRLGGTRLGGTGPGGPRAVDERVAVGDRVLQQPAQQRVGILDARLDDADHGELHRVGRRVPAEALLGDLGGPAEAPGLLGRVRHLLHRPAAQLAQPAGRRAVEPGQHLLGRQHRDRERELALGGGDGQGRGRAAQRDVRVDPQVVAGQPDDGRHEPDQLGAALVAGVVVDQAGERGQQRMGAGRVVAPPLAGQVGRQFHETGAALRVAMPAAGQDRHVIKVIVHGVLHAPRDRRPASLRCRARQSQ